MPISLECENCGHRYSLPDELAGRKAKCKVCQAVFVVPPPKVIVDQTAGGSVVYRHAERESKLTIPTDSCRYLDEIESHIKEHIGQVELVWHEILSDVVHIDVHWVKPTAERPFHTLITSGMSDKPMTVPPGAEEYRFAEMMISLPPEWPISEESFADESNYWPLRWLKILARFPHEYDTWLCFGHTLPNEEPPQPYAPNTALCCALLMPPLCVPRDFKTLTAADGTVIRFYAFVPLYKEEMDFKLEKGFDPLIDLCDQHQVNEILRIDRPNMCQRKKSWWSR